MSAVMTKLAAALFSSDKGQKALRWIALIVCSPFILVILLFCALGSETANYNGASLDLCFNGGEIPDDFPVEYRTRISDLQRYFGDIDSIGASVNGIMVEGSMDLLRMKAILYTVYCQGVPVDMTFETFMRCFYRSEQREREVPTLDEEGNPVLDENGEPETQTQVYSVAWPRTLEESYALLEQAIGREITPEDRDNAEQIYNRFAPPDEGGA